MYYLNIAKYHENVDVEIYDNYMIVNKEKIDNDDHKISIINVNCQSLNITNKVSINYCQIYITHTSEKYFNLTLHDIATVNLSGLKINMLYVDVVECRIDHTDIKDMRLNGWIMEMYLNECVIGQIIPMKSCKVYYARIEGTTIFHFGIIYIENIRLVNKTYITFFMGFSPSLLNVDLTKIILNSRFLNTKSNCIDKLGDKVVEYLISDTI